MRQMLLGRTVEGDKPVYLVIDAVLQGGILITASSGNGKSWTLRLVAELINGECQEIMLDPEGEFASLRELKDSNFILGGRDDKSDIKISAAMAEMFARKVLELNLDVIADIYDLKHDSKRSEKREFLAKFINGLVDAPKELWGRQCIVMIDEAHQHCLSADTELLTSSGWRKYTEIKVGDLAFAYDKDTSKLELQPIERIIVKEHTGELIRLENEDSIDSLITPDHRVLCKIRTTLKDRSQTFSEQKFISAGDLPTGILIPVVGHYENNAELAIDDNMLKIIGWIISDGNKHISRNTFYSYAIAQSEVKGQILTEMLQTAKERFPNASIFKKEESYRVFSDRRQASLCSPAYRIYLGIDATHEIDEFMHGITHRIPRIILNKCSTRQLKILFNALVQRDGSRHTSINGYQSVAFYPGIDEGLADDFQELCIRLGYSAVKKWGAAWDQNQFFVRVSFKRTHASVRKIKKAFYNGKVWDITIKYGAFIARRVGKPFITGNCPQTTKRFEDTSAKDAIIALCEKGRKRGLRVILATQRLAKLDKDASSEMKNQLIGGLNRLDDRKRAMEEIGGDVKNQDMLRTIPPGQFLAMGPAFGFKDPVLIKIEKVTTKHLKAGEMLRNYTPPVTEKTRAVLKQLEDLPAEVQKELKTKQDLEAEVARLKVELRKKDLTGSKSPVRIVETPPSAEAMKQTFDDGYKKGWGDSWSEWNKFVAAVPTDLERIAGKIEQLNAIGPALTNMAKGFREKLPLTAPAMPNFVPKVRVAAPTAARPISAPAATQVTLDGSVSLGKAERLILKFLATRAGKSFNKTQIGALTGYSATSGGFANSISKLKSAGLIMQSGSMYSIDDSRLSDAIRILGDDYNSQDKGALEQWLNTLPTAAKKIYDLLLANPAQSFVKSDIAGATGYSATSGGFANAISKLCTLGLAQRNGDGTIQFNQELLIAE